MNINLITDEIIFGNNTLSDEGRDDMVYELIDIYSRMPKPIANVGVMTFAKLSDKEMVLTLISAYEADAIRFFFNCSVEPNKVDY